MKDPERSPWKNGSFTNEGEATVVFLDPIHIPADEALAVDALPSKEAVAKPCASRSAKTSAKTTSHIEVSSAPDVQVVPRKHP